MGQGKSTMAQRAETTNRVGYTPLKLHPFYIVNTIQRYPLFVDSTQALYASIRSQIVVSILAFFLCHVCYLRMSYEVLSCIIRIILFSSCMSSSCHQLSLFCSASVMASFSTSTQVVVKHETVVLNKWK